VSNHNTQGLTNNRSGQTKEDNGDEDRQFWTLTTTNAIIAVNSTTSNHNKQHTFLLQHIHERNHLSKGSSLLCITSWSNMEVTKMTPLIGSGGKSRITQKTMKKHSNPQEKVQK